MAPTMLKSTVSFLLLSLVNAAPNPVPAVAARGLERRAVTVATTLPAGWTSKGCYVEGANGRALPLAMTASGTMTEATCITFCSGKGYSVAGVEYSQECWCGNTITTATAPLTDCNMGCSGKTTEACGGPNRLNVFSNGAVPTQPATPPAATSAAPAGAPVHNPGPPGWSLLGCYAEGTGGRALTNGMGVTGGSPAMTVALCTAACQNAGYTLAGVEYSGECYCGNAWANGGAPAPNGFTGCNMLCNGNKTEYCGGPNRLDAYTKGATPPAGPTTTAAAPPVATTTAPAAPPAGMPAGWTYKGCYTEGTNGRAIIGSQQPDSNTMTLASCANLCNAAGYKVAGMEFSSQCFCGNDIRNGGQLAASDTECSNACAGDATQKCGGPNRLSIYSNGPLQVYQPPAAQKTGLPGSWTYQGCLQDNVPNAGRRTFKWQLILPNTNNAQTCLSACSTYGYMAGGMEYGQECYCGDATDITDVGAAMMPEADCNVPCSGTPNYLCGAGNRISYYKWTGTPLNVWHYPQGAGAGKYELLIGGVTVPLWTTTGVNGKYTFLEKSGTGAPNTTGAYELDPAFINDFSKAWRPMHVKTDVFCSAGITLPDKVGRQLNIGGWAGPSTYGVRLYWPDGKPGVPGVNDWQENVDELSLQRGRWYPSALIMSNGSILVVGGEVGSNGAPEPTLEILPKVGPPITMPFLQQTDPLNLYPFICVLPSGGIFIAAWNQARIWDPVNFSTLKTLPQIPGNVNNPAAGRTYPLEGTAVLLPQIAPYSDPLTVLICGGSTTGAAEASDNCVSVQPDAAAPVWTIERMPSQRVISCMTALPDGTYMILNGAHHGVAGFGLANSPNLNAVLYDPSQPVNQRFSVMANTTVARLYHSEAILMQDGRVLVSGSNPEDGVNPDEYRVEVFSPPYLLNGIQRPTYTIANKDWAYNAQIPISVTLRAGSSGANVKVSLMGAETSTHGNSMGQRTIFPAVTCTAGTTPTCTITAPPNGKICPPGWYQVFVLDSGTPSVSTWVRIGGDPAQLGNWPPYPDFLKPGL